METLTPKQKTRLLDSLFYICQNPTEWDQRHWGTAVGSGEPGKPGDITPGTACGTAFCLAGHAAIRNGGTPVWSQAFSEGLRMNQVINPLGDYEYTSVYAQEVLGLGDEEATKLFHQDNTLDDLVLFVSVFVDDTFGNYDWEDLRAELLHQIRQAGLSAKARLVDTMCHILRSPEEWKQGAWGVKLDGPDAPACGTAFCFAGHAAVRAGAVPIWEDGMMDYVTTPLGGKQAVSGFASDILGLNEINNHLFSGSNSLNELKTGVINLVAKETFYNA